MYTAEKIASIVQGELLGSSANEIVYLSADSRKIAFPAQTIFIAIKKERRDGHQFIQDVYEQGVRSFIISEAVDILPFADAAFIRVNDSMEALQTVAAFQRSQFKIPIIGITGSNGKTIVKEWLYQLLQQDYRIARNPKSYNSQLGVPLSVWQLNAGHQLGIFEAGISLPNEMQALQKIIQPTIGILTNIGPAHSEGFADIQQKLDEKLLLFNEVEQLICCTDNVLIKEAVAQLSVSLFTWGAGEDCTARILSKQVEEDHTIIHLSYQFQQCSFRFAFTDDANIENVMHCIATMLYLGYREEIINERLKGLQPVEMRLEWKKAIANSYILDDSYSNDLASLIIALDYVKQQQRGDSITVVLTDIGQHFQTKMEADVLYGQVISLLQQYGIKRLIAVGELFPSYAIQLKTAGIEVFTFETTAGLLEALPEISFNNETILVKGARRFGLEKLVAMLEHQTHQTVLEINLSAMAHNLQQYRQLLQPSTKIMVMVKAFGYGSGDAEVAKLLQFNKVDYLAVAYTDEGIVLRKAGIHLPIMVMNPEPASFKALEEHNLEPEIFSFNILASFSQYCQQQGLRQYPVHLKIDTGMHRLGFLVPEIPELVSNLCSQNLLLVKTAFTHLASSELAEHDDFTQQQADLFLQSCMQLEKGLGYSFLRHMVNTAGIRRHPALQLDMVRLGIGLYGVDDSSMNLQTVTTLKTTVAQVKQLKAGDTVGYNRKGRAEKDTSIATIRVGYADGFRRAMSNGKGSVWIKGKLAPVIGNVAMDMTMVDITGIPGVKAGDAVEIFGTHLPVQQMAKLCDTIAYDILTGVSQRVKRVYLQE